MNTFARFLALGSAVYAASAVAHPLAGVGPGFATGAAHPFQGLDHALAAIAVGVWAVRAGRPLSWAAPLLYVAAMLIGCALGRIMVVPHIESMLAASVIALGLLICVTVKSPRVPLLAIAIFALAHGCAHALPAHGDAYAYFAGLAAATGTLLAAGALSAACLTTRTYYAGAAISLAGMWMLVHVLAL